METLAIKERFIELRAKGWSFDKIAKELGKAKQTLIDWSKELEEEIANCKALELEALYEKYYILKEHRITSFGKVVGALNKEIESRDLSEVPTDKLLELLLKYSNQLKEDIVEPRFKTSQEIIEDKLDKEILGELTSFKTAPEDKESKLKIG